MPDAPTFVVGQQIVLQGTFKNRAGTLTNPTTVVLKVTDPAGTTTTVTNAQQSTGVYEGTFTPTIAGDHYWSMKGTAGLIAAGREMFVAVPDRTP